MSGSNYPETTRLVIYLVLNVPDKIRVSRKTYEKRSVFVTNHSQFKKKEANVGDVFNNTPPLPPNRLFLWTFVMKDSAFVVSLFLVDIRLVYTFVARFS
jgi:hypothetical protein